MSRAWSHVAMLLLGLSLAVGFYEGRRLVRNTAKALTAAGRIGEVAERQERRETRAQVQRGGPSMAGPAGQDDLVEAQSPRGRKGRKAPRRDELGMAVEEPFRARRRRLDRLRQLGPASLGARPFGPVLGGLPDGSDLSDGVHPRGLESAPMASRPGGLAVAPGLGGAEPVDPDDEPLDTGALE